MCCGCCCPQLCQRSTVWQWRRVIVSWRSWSLTGPTRCGWWLSTIQAAPCPARDSPSEPVSPHTGAKVTTIQQICPMKLKHHFIFYWNCEGSLHFCCITVSTFFGVQKDCPSKIKVNFPLLLVSCSFAGSSISASDWYRALHCHVGFSHAAVELSKTESRTELHLGVLPSVWTGGRGAQVGVYSNQIGAHIDRKVI